MERMTSKPVKKKRPKIPAKPVPVAKGKANRKKGREIKPTWVACGFDVSMSSIAGAAFAYDKVLDKFIGPSLAVVRWQKDDHYFTRMKAAAMGSDIVHELLNGLKVIPESDEIYIAIEEPFPFGMVGRAQSAYLKQQAQISGALMGGFLRWGYWNIFEISNVWWRQVVAADLGITVHHSKWKDPKLVKRFNCKPDDTGKFRAKQWVEDCHPEWKIPDMPDIIESSQGKIPRPEDSKAKAVQCDDRYEGIAMAKWMANEIQEGRT